MKEWNMEYISTPGKRRWPKRLDARTRTKRVKKNRSGWGRFLLRAVVSAAVGWLVAQNLSCACLPGQTTNPIRSSEPAPVNEERPEADLKR